MNFLGLDRRIYLPMVALVALSGWTSPLGAQSRQDASPGQSPTYYSGVYQAPVRAAENNRHPLRNNRPSRRSVAPANFLDGPRPRTVQQTGYVPQHARRGTGQPRIVGGYAPRSQSIVGGRLAGQNVSFDQVISGQDLQTPVEGAMPEYIEGGEIISSDGYIDGGYIDGGYIDDGYMGESVGGGCATCGPGLNYGTCGCGDFENCPICRRCWIFGLGGFFQHSEFFAGTQGFDNIVPGSGYVTNGPRDPNDPYANLVDLNSHFGYHFGLNFGFPLKLLTCGLISAQIGGAYYGSDLQDGVRREQTFVTVGLFRRVDCGLQFGVVADVLNEEWLYKSETVQIRGELSYAYLNGANLGFRWSKQVQDGRDENEISQELVDQYRFFARKPVNCGKGFVDGFVGWTGNSYGIVGAEAEFAIAPRVFLQTGSTYFWPKGDMDDGWNLHLRFVFRPGGANWYRDYHRPMFNVADNGTMMTVLK